MTKLISAYVIWQIMKAIAGIKVIIFFSAYCNKKDIKGIFYISKLFIDNKILENVNNKWILLFMSAIIMCCIS